MYLGGVCILTHNFIFLIFSNYIDFVVQRCSKQKQDNNKIDVNRNVHKRRKDKEFKVLFEATNRSL